MKTILIIILSLYLVQTMNMPGIESHYKVWILQHIIDHESFQAMAYWDINRWSIGYGTRGYEGQVITKSMAYLKMAEAFNPYYLYVNKRYELSQWNTYVLAAFMYNVGSIGPGLEKALQSQDINAIKKAMLRYVKAGGEVMPGLVKRRITEINLLK